MKKWIIDRALQIIAIFWRRHKKGNSSGNARTTRLDSRSKRDTRTRFFRYSARTILIVLFCLLPCGAISGDGEPRYALTKAMLFHHSLSIPPEIARSRDGQLIRGIVLAPNGKFYAKYGIATSVVWLIPTIIAWVVSHLTGKNLDRLATFGISFVNPFVVLATAKSMVWALREFDLPGKVQLITILLYFFGASTLAYANTPFSEPLAGLFLLWAIVLPVARPGVKAAIISAILLTCCAVTKPEFAMLPVLLSPLFLGEGRSRSLTAFCVTAAIGTMLFGLNNLLCRGSVVQFSYGAETSMFQAPWIGITNYFFGISRNVILFNPALLFSVIGVIASWRRSQWKRISVTTLLVWLVYLPFYASWHGWAGGSCFGPRFFQSFIPLTLLSSGEGLTWVVARARASGLAAIAAILLFVFVVATVPLQIVGLCINYGQANYVYKITGRSAPWTEFQLMALKLSRGIRHPEIYYKSDFVKLPRGEQDTEIDFRSEPAFQYLNHWWLNYIANRERESNAGSKPVG